jgi:alkylation response protein AidB-like acyl-CoA dehydrogenase
VAARTGGPGMKGISVFLIEKSMPGLKVKPMNCTGMWSSGTSYITFEDMKIPKRNLIGKENEGFKYIMYNFNHERWSFLSQCIRFSRVCYEEAFLYANKRETFGKKLIESQVIRAKLGNMARQIEAANAWLELITFQMTKMDHDEQNVQLSGPIAILKTHITLMFEFCAREAIQIFGGLGYTRGGQGEKIERLYRDVHAYAIGGGSEEVLLDLGVRQAMKTSKL